MSRRHAAPADGSPDPQEPSHCDEELIRRLRDGFAKGVFDSAAAAALYRRHRPVALARARQLSADAHQAEDLLSESILRTLHALRSGAGPTTAWRPYLLTVIRHMAAEWSAESRRTLPTTDFSWLEHRAPDLTAGAADPQQHVLDEESRRILVRSVRQLPQQWRTMLWQSTVEGIPHHVLARRFGMTSNGVAALAARARKGLRETYLQAHLALVADAWCIPFQALLGAPTPPVRKYRFISRHLAACSHCARVYDEAPELSAALRALLRPASAPASRVAAPPAPAAGSGTDPVGAQPLLKASA
ncbi:MULTISPECIES: RNA polymerase sigma factor [unclassified Streptomyces]|uniref:Sigma-70 family RNA polymerase sigma factor n=1 Tax=Streptomyces sp. NBC_00060 TaxID=2975636 RepID=A0AAU2GQR4_9ACTN